MDHDHHNHSHGNGDDGEEEEELDPRIAVELEKLNVGTAEINTLEKELDRSNTTFRSLLNHTSRELEALKKKIGNSTISQARPYYEALATARNAHRACLNAAAQYQRANEIHSEAKALVKQAEIRNPKSLDSAWQEVLNHATIKVMEAEELRKSSESDHRQRAEEFKVAEAILQDLERNLHSSIIKSRPYFELKDRLNSELLDVKNRIEKQMEGVGEAKKLYSKSLQVLECISEEIHERRKGTGVRMPGVGAEQSSCSSSSISSYSSNGSGNGCGQ